MKITVTKPDGTVAEQSVDVPTAAMTIRALWNAERTLRDELIAGGVDFDVANRIVTAGIAAARATAHAAGLVPAAGGPVRFGLPGWFPGDRSTDRLST